MAKSEKKDPSKYPTYYQYAFRASKDEIEGIQADIQQLYDKFNKGRDPKAPQGKKAVKVSDIALEALKLGIVALRKRSKCDFSEE